MTQTGPFALLLKGGNCAGPRAWDGSTAV